MNSANDPRTSPAAFTLVELPAMSDAKRALRLRSGQAAFTLVELLVVVTIIAVLLSLLVPALSEAMYQADLAKCGANMRTTGAGLVSYAMSSKRFYPLRGLQQAQAGDPGYDYSYIAATSLADRTYGQFDGRPYLKDIIQINKNLVDPLCLPVELEIDKGADENVAASYTMWWGWRYKVPSATSTSTNTTGTPSASVNNRAGWGEQGMYQLGDVWTWGNEKFSLLMGDYDLNLGGGDANPIQGSHPDDEMKLNPYAFKYQPLFGTGAGIPITGSLYMHQGDIIRGKIDMNHLYDDVSVQRLTKVKGWHNWPKGHDERMTLVPNMANWNQAWKYYQVPKH
jgi:prepilin-type N-terminal cleavage/methylation domain-containing protein